MQQLIKRLESIKAAISLEDEESIALHLDKIRSKGAEIEGLPAIIICLDAFDYMQALGRISDFIEKHRGSEPQGDIESAALKMEMHGLESKLMELSIKREEFLYAVSNFNRQYSLRLDAAILKILKLQIMIACVKEAEYLGDEEWYAKYEKYRKKRQEAQEAYRQFQQLSDVCRMHDLAKVVEEILVSLRSGGGFIGSSKEAADKEEMRSHITDLRQQADVLEAEIKRIQDNPTWHLLMMIGEDYEPYLIEQEAALNKEMTRLRQQFLEMVWWESDSRLKEQELVTV